MNDTVLLETRFWLLKSFSLILPTMVYARLLFVASIPRRAVLAFSLILVATAAVDVYLLQALAAEAKLSASLVDDWIFNSGVSLTLYLLPALFGGIGINVISHVRPSHLEQAEARAESRRSASSNRGP